MKYNIDGNHNGELLIFITGAGIGKCMWKNQIEYFKDYKCITFDLPGHGENIGEDFTSFESLKKELLKIIKKESNDGMAFLIGFSFGAQCIMHMLKEEDVPIKKCVIVSGMNKRMKHINRVTVGLTIKCLRPIVRTKEFTKHMAKQSEIPKDMFHEYYEVSKALSYRSLRNIMYEYMKFSLDQCKNSEVECLVLAGEKEGNLTLKSSKKTVEVIENSEMRIIPEVGHSIPYNKPEEFNKIVYKFLRK